MEAEDGVQLLVEHNDPLRSRLDHGDALNMHRVQGQTVDNAITVLSGQDRQLNSQSLVYVLASRARDGFTVNLDDKERVIAQIERNGGKSLHALDLESGADKAAREADAKVEKQYSEQSDSTVEGNVKSERLVSDTLRSNLEPHNIAENVPVREPTRDFDIS